MRKHLTRGKEYDQHRKLELNPLEKNTRMKIGELATVEHLHGKSPDKNTDRKRMEKLHIHKMDT